MASSLWISHVYSDDAVLPLPGEVIKIRAIRANTADTTCGPRSEMPIEPAAATSFQHVIVSAVTPSPDKRSFVIGFFPIVTYSTPPPSFKGALWNPVAWMQVQPLDTVLRHLPVPAVNWDPAPPELWGTDHLDFGAWRNSRASWAYTVLRTATIPVAEGWRRVSPPAMLSQRDLAVLRDFESTAVVYLLAQNSMTANCSDDDGVWTGKSASEVEYVDDDDDDDDDDGWDDIDPISMWRFPGAPEEMRQWVMRADEEVKRMWEEGIKAWLGGIGQE